MMLMYFSSWRRCRRLLAGAIFVEQLGDDAFVRAALFLATPAGSAR